MKARRISWIAAALLAGAIAIGYGPDLWWRATHERVYFSTLHDDFAGWNTVHRWTGESEGEYRFWDIETGMLVTLGWIDAREERVTGFTKDGRIEHQEHGRGDHLEERTEPPWWWGAEPRTTPDAPWIRAEISFEEWRERIIDRRRR